MLTHRTAILNSDSYHVPFSGSGAKSPEDTFRSVLKTNVKSEYYCKILNNHVKFLHDYSVLSYPLGKI